jgi:hypothetical protein
MINIANIGKGNSLSPLKSISSKSQSEDFQKPGSPRMSIWFELPAPVGKGNGWIGWYEGIEGPFQYNANDLRLMTLQVPANVQTLGVVHVR